MGIAIFIKSRLIPRRDAIYRVRLSNKSRPPNKYERGKSWKHGRDKPYCGRDKSRPYNAANGATARSKMPLT